MQSYGFPSTGGITQNDMNKSIDIEPHKNTKNREVMLYINIFLL